MSTPAGRPLGIFSSAHQPHRKGSNGCCLGARSAECCGCRAAAGSGLKAVVNGAFAGADRRLGAQLRHGQFGKQAVHATCMGVGQEPGQHFGTGKGQVAGARRCEVQLFHAAGRVATWKAGMDARWRAMELNWSQSEPHGGAHASFWAGLATKITNGAQEAAPEALREEGAAHHRACKVYRGDQKPQVRKLLRRAYRGA